jgi:hypothetical protein
MTVGPMCVRGRCFSERSSIITTSVLHTPSASRPCPAVKPRSRFVKISGRCLLSLSRLRLPTPAPSCLPLLSSLRLRRRKSGALATAADGRGGHRWQGACSAAAGHGAGDGIVWMRRRLYSVA